MYVSLVPMQACAPIDPTNSVGMKNRNEVLRCFAVACKHDTTALNTGDPSYMYIHVHTAPFNVYGNRNNVA